MIPTQQVSLIIVKAQLGASSHPQYLAFTLYLASYCTYKNSRLEMPFSVFYAKIHVTWFCRSCDNTPGFCIIRFINFLPPTKIAKYANPSILSAKRNFPSPTVWANTSLLQTAEWELKAKSIAKNIYSSIPADTVTTFFLKTDPN